MTDGADPIKTKHSAAATCAQIKLFTGTEQEETEAINTMAPRVGAIFNTLTKEGTKVCKKDCCFNRIQAEIKKISDNDG